MMKTNLNILIILTTAKRHFLLRS